MCRIYPIIGINLNHNTIDTTKRKTRKHILLFLAVLLVGIFFRVYNFSEYVRFNPDQSRDAKIVREIVSGKEDAPLLGPKAGGTEFRLGPVFYYFQIFSAKIWGDTPDKLAYPDLLTSILAIPLLFFFLRKFFPKNISFLSTAVFAVSFYVIKYARFAWNPNSIPFYVLLFLLSILEISASDTKRKWLWAVILGVSLGVGVQLHSLLLFSFPFVFLIYFSYLFFKKNTAWKFAPLIIFIALLLNVPMVINEFQTDGKNTQAFVSGLEKKSNREGGLPYKFVLNSACHIQANSFMLLPFGSTSRCNFIDRGNNPRENNLLFFHMAFASIFSIGGYYLLFRFWRKEKDEKKKNFLSLILLYAGTLFLILIPLAAEISLRFFLVLEFMPFLLLSFWCLFLKEKFPHVKASLIAVLLVILLGLNLYAVIRNFSYLAGNTEEGSNGFEEITLGEIRFMAEFIEVHNPERKNVYLEGKASELFKIIKSIRYFTDEKGIKASEFGKNDKLLEEDELFLIDLIKNPQKDSELSEKNKARYNVLDEARYRRIKIYELKEK